MLGTRPWFWPTTSVGRVLAESWTRHAAIRVLASGHIARPLGLAERDCLDQHFILRPRRARVSGEQFDGVSARRGGLDE